MKKKILIVDDSLNLRLTLKKFLEAQYNLEFAENGQECLDLLEKTKDIDMLILDVNMPVKDGIQVVHEIGKRDDINDLHTIMLTTETSDEKKNDIKKYNFVRCWVIKPITEDLIRATIERIFLK